MMPGYGMSVDELLMQARQSGKYGKPENESPKGLENLPVPESLQSKQEQENTAPDSSQDNTDEEQENATAPAEDDKKESVDAVNRESDQNDENSQKEEAVNEDSQDARSSSGNSEETDGGLFHEPAGDDEVSNVRERVVSGETPERESVAVPAQTEGDEGNDRRGVQEAQEDYSESREDTDVAEGSKRLRRASRGSNGAAGSKPKKFAPKKDPDDEKGVNVKGLPPYIMQYMRDCFSSDNKYADIVSAYVYMTSNQEVPVEPHIREVARTWNGRIDVQDLSRQIEELHGQISKMDLMVRELELALSFLIMDRLGFRSRAKQPLSPAQISFTNDGYRDTIACMRMQANQLKNKEEAEKSRRIK